MAKKTSKKEVKNEGIKIEPNKFTKAQILKSKKLQDYKDILNVVLKEDGLYTIDEAEMKIKEFKRRVVVK
ncbi:MAG TPA: hypothetical protein PLK32_06740 [Defluviitoga tunisiensis]|nr:hypothetical protein [Defluviitoga tunisiensis]